MKSEVALLRAWRETLARKGDAPAIFDTRGEVLRTFAQIEERSREIEESLGSFRAGSVVAIQIGNHEDWPAWLIRILRRGLVALPLELGMAEDEKTNALRTCNVAAVVAAPKAFGAEYIEILPMETSA